MRMIFLFASALPLLPAAEWAKRAVAADFRTHTASAGDFTGDGKVDIIANDSTGKRDVLFIAPDWKQVVLHTGANAIHSLAVDMDGDGDLDYAAAQYSPGLLYWLEQPRHGAREPWTMHVIDDAARGGIHGIHGIAAGDLNGDGKPDIVGNSAQPKGAFPESIAWFAGPKFGRAIVAGRDAPGLSHYIGIGDVNGDGRPDVASGAKIAEGGNWFAWWEQPREAGRAWRKHRIAENQEGASNIFMLDVNRDGRTDFLASRGHGKGVVWYEAPSWTQHEIDATHPYPHSLAIGDVDGDGDTDAVACSAVYDGQPKDPRLAWFENLGGGKFRTHVISREQAAYDVKLIDVDGDRDLDIVVAGQESRNVVWYEQR